MSRYQGKRLWSLLVALCLPAGLLYLRLVCSLTASETRVSPAQAAALNRSSTVFWILFLISQVVCARYLQRTMLPPARGHLASFLRYCAALVIGLIFSATAAITLEAIGFNFFVRMARVH